MASIVEAALKMTFGLFVDKARSSFAKNLKDGDINSQKFRELIVNSIEEINNNIKALSRRDLLSSSAMVQDGLFYLTDAIQKPYPGRFFAPDEAVSSVGVGDALACRVADTFRESYFDPFFERIVIFKKWLLESDEKEDDDSSISFPLCLGYDEGTAQDLIDAISYLQTNSPDQFNDAMLSFNNAYTRATDVFFDDSLALEDRIMAARLRVQSKLLLCLKKPEDAKLCMLYLKDLHDLGAVVENFRSDLEGGILTHFSKEEIHDIVLSVSTINCTVYHFLNCFTKINVNLYDWPLIEDGNWTYNPLIPNEKSFNELRRVVPYLVSLKPIKSKIAGMDPKLSAITSDGDLILFRQQDDSKVCELVKVSGSEVEVFHAFEKFTLLSCLTVDARNRVYAFADNVEGDIPPGCSKYDVFIFTEKGKVVATYNDFFLPNGSIVLAPTSSDHHIAMCVPKASKECIQGRESARVDEEILREKVIQEMKVRIRGEQFPESILIEMRASRFSLATITDKNEVITVENFGHHVVIFNQGEIFKEFKLQEGEDEKCVGITFNNLRNELVVVSYIQDGFFLSSYSLESEKRCHHVRLSHIAQDCKELQLTSHGRASIALITKEHVLFIQ